MAQVLQQHYNKVSNREIRNEATHSFAITKQLIYTIIVGMILGAWMMAAYLNNLFLKEAICSSVIILLLVYLKSKSAPGKQR